MMSWLDLSLKNLINALRKLTDWYDLGLQLDIEDHCLEKFLSENHAIEERKRAMLRFWLQSDEEASWEKLLLALREMKQHCLAKEIEKKCRMSSSTLSEDARQLVPNVTTQFENIPTTAPPTEPPEQTLITQSGSVPSSARKAKGGVLRKVLSQYGVQW